MRLSSSPVAGRAGEALAAAASIADADSLQVATDLIPHGRLRD